VKVKVAAINMWRMRPSSGLRPPRARAPRPASAGRGWREGPGEGRESLEECNVRALAAALLRAKAGPDDVGGTEESDDALRSVRRDDRTAIDVFDRHSSDDILHRLVRPRDDP